MPEVVYWIAVPIALMSCIFLKWFKDWNRLAQIFPGPYPEAGVEDDSLTFSISGLLPFTLKNCTKIKVNETSLSVLPYSAVGWRVNWPPTFSIPWGSITSCELRGSVIPVAELKLVGTSTKLYIQGDAAELVKQWHTRMSDCKTNNRVVLDAAQDKASHATEP
jgi:hypothetical protein